jgi:hypothetical protein
VQRALGYSYETEKAFQTGVKMTVTETLPPDPNLLKFMLERRQAGKYRETKEVLHTHNAGALFQRLLERMEANAKANVPLLEAEVIEVDVSPVLAEDPEPVDNQGLDPDDVQSPNSERHTTYRRLGMSE